ncbi:MAG TPA: ATP-binding cassette domain-containing protein [Terriglobales bacterium]|nr:ATP-binding cassette domain-containing protein [Terriglobales bacterium]
MSSNVQAVGTKESVALGVQGLRKSYFVRTALWRKRSAICAAEDISFELLHGKTLALVGSSGSGKSTVARCVARLEKPDAGEIWIGDANIAGLDPRQLRPFRSQIQMVFQDPLTAMNSRMSAAQVVEEPWLIQERGTRHERRTQAEELMKEVGLSSDWLDRRIAEFSGGQRQRIAIARALALQPKILVLDEALTGLDLSSQAQILELLRKLQTERSLSYLLISHDLALVARAADGIAVMAAGRIVEQGTTHQIISDPKHAETRALLAAGEGFRRALSKAHGASA